MHCASAIGYATISAMPEGEQRQGKKPKGPSKRITVEYPADFLQDNVNPEDLAAAMHPDEKREPTVVVGRPIILIPIIALMAGTFLIWLLYVLM